MRKKKQKAKPRRRAANWAEAVIVDYNRFLHWPGVEGLGIGIKEVQGDLGKKYCVKLYVRKKGDLAHPTHHLPAKARVLLPAGRGMYRMRWIPTDVIEAPTAVRSANPVRAGDQVGVLKGGGLTEVGTLTFIGTDPGGAALCLTAGHVISDEEGSVPVGVLVNQPAHLPPGGDPDDVVLGSASDGFVGPQPITQAYVDWALVTVQSGRQTDGNAARDPSFTFTKTRLSESAIVNGQLIGEMLGAQTGVKTTGNFSATRDLTLQSGEVLHKVIEFKSPDGSTIARTGDSGALMVSRTTGSEGKIIGMVCAANDPPDSRVYVYPLSRVSELDGFFH
jgi:hypothetical protein